MEVKAPTAHSWRNKAMVATAGLLPVVAMAQGNPWDAFFDGVETSFGLLLTGAYALAAVVVVGTIVFGLAKRFAKKSAS